MKLGLKFGFKMLLRNPVRVAASLLAAIAAFGIAGMCIFTLCYNTVPWERDTYFNSDDKYVNIAYGHNGYDAIWKTPVKLTIDDIGQLEKEIGALGCGYTIDFDCGRNSTHALAEQAIGAYRLSDHVAADEDIFAQDFCDYRGEILFAPYEDCRDGWPQSPLPPTWELYPNIYNNFYRRMTIYPNEETVQEFGYTLTGRLPQAVDEVAIPQWLYNCFLCYGYKDREGKVYQIDDEEDILGKTLSMTQAEKKPVYLDGQHLWDEYVWSLKEAAIVGIVHTDYEEEGFFEKNMQYREVDGERLWCGIDTTDCGIPPHVGIIVSRAFVDAYADMPAFQENNSLKYIVTLRYNEHAEEVFAYLTDWKIKRSFSDFWMTTQMVEAYVPTYTQAKEISLVYGMLPWVLNEVTVYFRIVPYLGVFAAILLAYLCFSTVMGRRRGVGTLQSLGASKKQIALAVGIPIFVFCLIASLGALCVELGFMGYMNGLLNTYVLPELQLQGYALSSVPYPFTLGWETVLFTFGVPLAIAAVATLVTVWLVFRTPVVDNLNKKEFRLFRKRR